MALILHIVAYRRYRNLGERFPLYLALYIILLSAIRLFGTLFIIISRICVYIINSTADFRADVCFNRQSQRIFISALSVYYLPYDICLI